MQKIFKVDWDPEQSGLQFKSQIGAPTCSWSTRNLVAFTTGHVESDDSKPWLSAINIHIVCPEYPWEVYQLKTDFKDQIEHLFWDRSSTRLLAINRSGISKVFAMRKSFLNSWECIHEIDLGSRVVCAAWLDPGSKYMFDAKAGHANLLEKFSKRFVKSTLADIAGLSKDGFVAVTEMGAACVVLLEKGSKVLKIQKMKLFGNRCRVQLGDICFKEDGKVHIVLATDKRVVEFFILSLRLVSTKVEISMEISPCIVPHVIADEEYMTYHISSVKFSNEANSEKILVCTESGSVTCLKLFELKIEKAALQIVLQRMAQNPKVVSVKEWTCCKAVSIQGKIAFITLTRMSNAGHPSFDIPMCPSILISTKEGLLHIVSSNLSDANSAVFSYQDEAIACLTYSPCDTCVFAVSECGDISIFQALSFKSVADSIAIKTCVNLFEYCLVTGMSSWDVAVFAASCGEKFLEQCSQYLRSNLLSQPSMTQERMAASYAQIQAEIYKGLDGLYFGTVESYNFLMLKSIYCFLHSTINMMSTEREAQIMLKIKSLCSRQLEIDLTKIVQLVEIKDLAVSQSLVASVQHLTQWIASYSMHICKLILFSLKTINYKQIISVVNFQGLKILREILAIIYIWGNSCPGWQPHFIELGNPSEILVQIFKLVSKLCLKLMQSDFNKETMNEEEIPMRGHPTMYTMSAFYDPKCGLISQCRYQEITNCSFNSVEETLTSAKKYSFPHPLEQNALCIVPVETFFDSINLIQTSLMKGETLKQCIQCSCLTLSITNPNRCLQNTWREQWNDVCFCGGFWRALDVSKEITTVSTKEESLPVNTK